MSINRFLYIRTSYEFYSFLLYFIFIVRFGQLSEERMKFVRNTIFAVLQFFPPLIHIFIVLSILCSSKSSWKHHLIHRSTFQISQLILQIYRMSFKEKTWEKRKHFGATKRLFDWILFDIWQNYYDFNLHSMPRITTFYIDSGNNSVIGCLLEIASLGYFAEFPPNVSKHNSVNIEQSFHNFWDIQSRMSFYSFPLYKKK